MFLYLDTTYECRLGLLDENFQWLSYLHVESHKVSDILFTQLENLCENAGFDSFKSAMSKLQCVYHCAGPGSYTGMRVGKTLVDLLADSLKIIDFYHFEVFKYLDTKPYIWETNAYKGEKFVARFHENNGQWEEEYSLQPINSLVNEELLLYSTLDSQNLLKDRPREIFSKIVSSRKELFYFRTLQKEFPVKLKNEKT